MYSTTPAELNCISQKCNVNVYDVLTPRDVMTITVSSHTLPVSHIIVITSEVIQTRIKCRNIKL